MRKINLYRIMTPMALTLVLLSACSPKLAGSSAVTQAPAGGQAGGAYPALTEVPGANPSGGATSYPVAGETAGPTRPTTAPAQSAYPSPGQGGVAVQVVKPDGTLISLTASELQSLPQTQALVDGQPVSGPRLSEVLARAGAADYSQVIVSGASGEATLARAQIGDQTILAIGADGSLSLADPALPADQRVGGVTQIKVQ